MSDTRPKYLDSEASRRMVQSASVSCTPRNASVLSCNMSNIEIRDCTNVTIECDNEATTTVYACEDPVLLAQEIAAQLIAFDDAAKDKLVDALTRSGFPTSTAELQTAVQSYILTQCNPQLVSNQMVVVPKIVLEGPNCTNEQILGANRLDQASQCVTGSLTRLFQLAGLGPPDTQPAAFRTKPFITFTPLISTSILFGFVILILVAVLLGLYLRCLKHGK